MKVTALDLAIIIAFVLSSLIIVFLGAQFFWLGFIWAIVTGLAIGSYATTPIARIPYKVALHKKKPHCLKCGTLLEPRDLFPIVSYILNRGKCRFCCCVIPPILFYSEILVLFNYLLCYTIYGFGEEYLIVTFFFTTQIIHLSIWFNNRIFSNGTLIFSLLIALFYRLYLGESWVQLASSGVVSLILALIGVEIFCRKTRILTQKSKWTCYIAVLIIWFMAFI